MKKLLILLMLIFVITLTFGQSDPKATIDGNLEVNGKVSQSVKPTEGSDLVTKAHMDSVLIKFALMLDDGIQLLLNTGYTPKELMDQGANLNSLIGKEFGGGKIFYLLADGTGLIIKGAFSDNDGITWGCQGTSIATSSTFGSGLSNTIAIATACRDANIAASRALDFSLDGYDDWYLPSKGELEIALNNIGIEALADRTIWTSTQVDAFDAYVYTIDGLNFQSLRKGNATGVSVIREF